MPVLQRTSTYRKQRLGTRVRLGFRYKYILQDSYDKANVVLRHNIGVSNDCLQPYLEEVRGFRLPPVQSIERYFKAYMQSNHLQFIHKSIRPEDTHVALNLAMLALGAQFLLENWNATSLFKASRNIALKLWTSQETVRQKGLQYVKVGRNLAKTTNNNRQEISARGCVPFAYRIR